MLRGRRPSLPLRLPAQVWSSTLNGLVSPRHLAPARAAGSTCGPVFAWARFRHLSKPTDRPDRFSNTDTLFCTSAALSSISNACFRASKTWVMRPASTGELNAEVATVSEARALPWLTGGRRHGRAGQVACRGVCLENDSFRPVACPGRSAGLSIYRHHLPDRSDRGGRSLPCRPCLSVYVSS